MPNIWDGFIPPFPRVDAKNSHNRSTTNYLSVRSPCLPLSLFVRTSNMEWMMFLQQHTQSTVREAASALPCHHCFMAPPPRRPPFPASLSSFPPDRTFCNLIAGGNNALPRPLSLPLCPLSPCWYKKENGRPAETLLNNQPFVLRYTRGRRWPGSDQ